MAVYTATTITSIGSTRVSITGGQGYSYMYFLYSMLSRIFLLKSMDIYADNREQLIKVLKFTDKDAEGEGRYNIVAPQLYSDQLNYAISGLKLLKPLALNGQNEIDYTIKANEWVRLTFNMDSVDLGEEIEELPAYMKFYYKNPNVQSLEYQEFYEPEEVKKDNNIKK